MNNFIIIPDRFLEDQAPLSDREIEQLFHQEPVNQGLNLPAEEEIYVEIATN